MHRCGGWSNRSACRLGPMPPSLMTPPGCVCAASGWEIATKVRLGKLPAANELVDNLTLVTREELVPLPDATPNAVHMGQHLGIQLMHQQ